MYFGRRGPAMKDGVAQKPVVQWDGERSREDQRRTMLPNR